LIGPSASPNRPNRNVVLLLDRSAKQNLICSRVITELFGEALPPAPPDGNEQLVVRAFKNQYTTSGAISISWALRDTPEDAHVLECLIVQDDEAPFDVIAGRTYIDNNEELRAVSRS
jgi:hypothetical protein